MAKPDPRAERARRNRTLLTSTLIASALISLAMTFDWLPSTRGFGGALTEGDIVQVPIKAPVDISIVDMDATEAERRSARESAPLIYDFDDAWARSVRSRVAEAFEAAAKVRARREEAAQAQAQADEATPPVPNAKPVPATPAVPPGPATPPGPTGVTSSTSPDPEDAFRAALGPNVTVSSGALEQLLDPGRAAEAQQATLRVLRSVLVLKILEDRSELDRQASGRPIEALPVGSRSLFTMQPGDLVPLSGAAERLRATANEVMADRPAPLRDAVLELATALLRPNLSFNLRATEERRQAAAAGVVDVTITLRKGEIIVRDGERLTRRHVKVLQGIAAQTDLRGQIEGFLGTLIVTFIVLWTAWRLATSGIPRFAREQRDALFLLSTLVASAIGLKLGLFICDAIADHPAFAGMVGDASVRLYYGLPVACAAILVRLVHNAETTVLFSVVAALLAGLQLGELPFAFYVLVGSVVGALGAERVSQRGTLLLAGVRVGGVNVAMTCALLLLDRSASPVPVLVAVTAAFISGCLAGGLATALAPLVETVFKYTTDIKLLELANREQTLLRDLEVRAPGTYHHSMMVGHLAEKAAEAIGANPLLAKVAGYYHDIGKMKRPHFFVENSTITHGVNRHEKLTPSMSTRIIQAHVKDGLELGSRHDLAPAIMRGIGEHHGTTVTRFFYEKAKELIDPSKGETVQEHDYRYPGPKPQTREVGILMLADSVEAASRTLSDASRPRVQQLVGRIINNYFRDGQFDECNLTLRDLHAIARSLVDTLSAIRHERIDYPDPTDREGRPIEPKPDEGVVERLEVPPKDRPERAAAKREGDLKRLGQA